MPIPDDLAGKTEPDAELFAIDGVLDLLAAHDTTAAEVVKLHIFAGLTVERAGELLGISARTAYRNWAYARAWMLDQLGGPVET